DISPVAHLRPVVRRSDGRVGHRRRGELRGLHGLYRRGVLHRLVPEVRARSRAGRDARFPKAHGIVTEHTPTQVVVDEPQSLDDAVRQLIELGFNDPLEIARRLERMHGPGWMTTQL